MEETFQVVAAREVTQVMADKVAAVMVQAEVVAVEGVAVRVSD